jgi:hypothetical protein
MPHFATFRHISLSSDRVCDSPKSRRLALDGRCFLVNNTHEQSICCDEGFFMKRAPKPKRTTTRRQSKRSEAAWDYYEALVEAFGQEWPKGLTTQELIDEIRRS